MIKMITHLKSTFSTIQEKNFNFAGKNLVILFDQERLFMLMSDLRGDSLVIAPYGSGIGVAWISVPPLS